MENKTEEMVEKVSHREILEVLNNPGRAKDHLFEFVHDVEQLWQAVQILYSQHKVEFGIMGLRLHLTIESDAIGPLIDAEYGSAGIEGMEKDEG